MMKRKGRKEITIVGFKGVLKNGSFMFLGTVFSHHLDSIWRIVPFQVLSYQNVIKALINMLMIFFLPVCLLIRR